MIYSALTQELDEVECKQFYVVFESDSTFASDGANSLTLKYFEKIGIVNMLIDYYNKRTKFYELFKTHNTIYVKYYGADEDIHADLMVMNGDEDDNPINLTAYISYPPKITRITIVNDV